MRTFMNLAFWGSLIVIGLFCAAALLIGAWCMFQWSPWTTIGLIAAVILFGASGYFKAILDLIHRGA